MLAIRRILVPTDFSQTSDLAVDYAIDTASRHGGAIELLHVVDEANRSGAYLENLSMEWPAIRDRLIEEAEQRLAVVRARCAAAGIPASSQVLGGKPARMIAGRATERGTDLIVMGTHGRTGLSHLVLGSVAERVLRIAPCPVLVVRDTARVADILAAERARGDLVPVPYLVP